MIRAIEDFNELIDTIAIIEGADDKDSLLRAISSYLKQFGVKHITIGAIINPNSVLDKFRHMGVTNFPKEFCEFWVERDLILHDPVLFYANRSKSAFEWRDAYSHASRFGRNMMNISADMGLGEGLAVPIFCPGKPNGMVSLALEERIVDPTLKAIIEIPIIHAFNRLMSFTESRLIPNDVNLTLREVDILHYIAAGKTNWETGKILGISENTVKKILQNILSKYGTSSRTHAVAIAIRQGAILP